LDIAKVRQYNCGIGGFWSSGFGNMADDEKSTPVYFNNSRRLDNRFGIGAWRVVVS
jgi:hypothetical protein